MGFFFFPLYTLFERQRIPVCVESGRVKSKRKEEGRECDLVQKTQRLASKLQHLQPSTTSPTLNSVSSPHPIRSFFLLFFFFSSTRLWLMRRRFFFFFFSSLAKTLPLGRLQHVVTLQTSPFCSEMQAAVHTRQNN